MRAPSPADGLPLALEVSGLTVGVGQRTLVSDVDLRIRPGERVALIGASGSGKSLTARSVLGSLPHDAHVAGRVRVGGVDVLGIPVPRRAAAARVAFVAQDPGAALNPIVPIGTQLSMPLRRHRGLRGAALAEVRTDLMTAVGIEDPARILRSCAGELSGGQRQRVCIALALASRAGLLIADEPTTALDLVTQAQVVEVLRQQTRDVAVLFITHDIAVAAALCDRAVVLAGGAVVEAATMAQLIADPQHPHTRRLVAAVPRAAAPPRGPDHLAGSAAP